MGTQSLKERMDIPEPAMGAPLPFVLGDERGISLCYHSEKTVADADYEDVPDKVAILRFTEVWTSYLGGLDENLQHTHLLGDLGLTNFYAWEVNGSELISRMNVRDRQLRHIIVLFHDSMFEVVCESYTVREIMSEFVADAVSEETDYYFET